MATCTHSPTIIRVGIRPEPLLGEMGPRRQPTPIDKAVTAEGPSQEGLLGGRSSDCRSQQQWNHVDETQHPGAKPQHPGNELTDQRNPTEQ